MKVHRPPKLAEKILDRLLYDDIWKTMLGDLQEFYQIKYEEEGKSKADFWYWRQIIQYAPSKIIHKMYWSVEMFLNYLTIAFRNIKKNKSYSFINISGLAIGLASFLLIGIYVAHELSFDRHYKDADRMYRIVRDAPNELYLGTSWFAVNPMPLSIGLADDFSGIESSTAVRDISGLFTLNEHSFFEQGIATDFQFFEVFSDLLLSGNSETAFNDPSSIVLTTSLAKKYFGSSNPIGKVFTITPEFEEPVLKTVTAIVKDPPTNAHLQYSFILPNNSLTGYDRESTFWGNNDEYSYIKTTEHVVVPELEEQITLLSDTQLKMLPYYSENPENLPNYFLQPISDVHLKSSHINFNVGKTSDSKYVYMLSIIGIIILVVASVNYMNLAIARSLNRAKEIGVRKVNGALRSNIIMQFTAEAVVFSLIAVAIAYVLVYQLLPPFNALVHQAFNSEMLLSPLFWLIIVTVGLFVGIISGIYPAFYISSLKPAGIFKQQRRGGGTNKKLRNVLVVGQFTITNVLIIASMVIFKQLDYIKTTDSGFNRDQILAVTVTDPELMNSYSTLESMLEAYSGILEVSSARSVPSEIRSQTSGIDWEGKQEDDFLRTYTGKINVDYTELLGIKLLAGRAFDPNIDSYTSNSFIINETMSKRLGWSPTEAIGKNFTLWRNDGTVVGVVQDFNFLSYHMAVEPLLLRYENIAGRATLLIKVAPENLPETLTFVEDQLAQFSPNYPFEYAFLDDAFNNMYQTELTLGKIFNYFTILALIIACMGLFGLASFMMEQRIKEIGVRKVLGADSIQIVTLLNKDFLKLVAFSFVIALPAGWFMAQHWLQNFAYKITLGPMIFVSTALLTFSIAFLTVSAKSIRFALANPVESLNSE